MKTHACKFDTHACFFVYYRRRNFFPLKYSVNEKCFAHRYNFAFSSENTLSGKSSRVAAFRQARCLPGHCFTHLFRTCITASEHRQFRLVFFFRQKRLYMLVIFKVSDSGFRLEINQWVLLFSIDCFWLLSFEAVRYTWNADWSVFLYIDAVC